MARLPKTSPSKIRRNAKGKFRQPTYPSSLPRKPRQPSTRGARASNATGPTLRKR